MLAGIEGSEDAGVYKLTDDLALVQTIDFFTPIVDDPRVFGRAAAANSLSDVYAMGGRPVTAMNVVCFPVKKLGLDVLRSILEGGLSIMREAGVALVGGHSVEDDEPKYGLSVTGLVHPDKIMINGGLTPGDIVVLTKPVGTGVVATAIKAGLEPSGAVAAMERSMCALNRAASEVAVRHGVRACTDVTGFGLAGHLMEMARASRCRLRLFSERVPLLEGAKDCAAMGLIPAGAYANRSHFGPWITIGPDVALDRADLIFDPQTSGGLALGVRPDLVDAVIADMRAQGIEAATVIGEVLGPDDAGRMEIV